MGVLSMSLGAAAGSRQSMSAFSLVPSSVSQHARASVAGPSEFAQQSSSIAAPESTGSSAAPTALTAAAAATVAALGVSAASRARRRQVTGTARQYVARFGWSASVSRSGQLERGSRCQRAVSALGVTEAPTASKVVPSSVLESKYGREIEVGVDLFADVMHASCITSLLMEEMKDKTAVGLFGDKMEAKYVRKTEDGEATTIMNAAILAAMGKVLLENFPDDAIYCEEDVELLARDGEFAETVAETLHDFGVVADATAEDVVRWSRHCGTFKAKQASGSAPTRYWALNPIDNTTEMRAVKQFCITLALVEDGQPQVSLVGCPVQAFDHHTRSASPSCPDTATLQHGLVQVRISSQIMGRVLDLFAQQQAQIDMLRKGYEAIVEESEALRACLERTGGLAREQFYAQVHRYRFRRVLRKFPLTFAASAPLDVLQNPLLFHNLMLCAGLQAAKECSVVSRALHQLMDLAPPRLYAVGGSDGVGALNVVERFSERLSRWETLPPLPTARSNLVALASEGRLYAIGGTDGAQVLGTVEVYEEATNRWQSLPLMPTPRSGMAAAACGGNLYVIGGREGLQSLGIVERFHIGSWHWEALPPMQSRRRFLAATALHGRLYAVGGEDDRFKALGAAERFDEEVGRWEQLPPMPTRRRGLSAVALRGKIYAVGGGQVAQAQALGVVECYDVERDCWESLAPMSTPRMFLSAVALGGRLVALGGSDGAQALKTLERYDERSETWESLPPMPTRRVFFSAAVVHTYQSLGNHG